MATISQAAQKPEPIPEPIPVRISKTGQVIEADKVKKVKKSEETNLKWVAQDGEGPWIVTFNKADSVGDTPTYPVEPGSPFSEDSYEVPRGGTEVTRGGPVRGKVKKTYRYTVTNKDTGVVTHDPDVDVE